MLCIKRIFYVLSVLILVSTSLSVKAARSNVSNFDPLVATFDRLKGLISSGKKSDTVCALQELGFDAAPTGALSRGRRASDEVKEEAYTVDTQEYAWGIEHREEVLVATDKQGYSLLHYAAFSLNSLFVETVASFFANDLSGASTVFWDTALDLKDKKGRTPVQAAAYAFLKDKKNLSKDPKIVAFLTPEVSLGHVLYYFPKVRKNHGILVKNKSGMMNVAEVKAAEYVPSCCSCFSKKTTTEERFGLTAGRTGKDSDFDSIMLPVVALSLQKQTDSDADGAPALALPQHVQVAAKNQQAFQIPHDGRSHRASRRGGRRQTRLRRQRNIQDLGTVPEESALDRDDVKGDDAVSADLDV